MDNMIKIRIHLKNQGEDFDPEYVNCCQSIKIIQAWIIKLHLRSYRDMCQGSQEATVTVMNYCEKLTESVDIKTKIDNGTASIKLIVFDLSISDSSF